jgi:hypothetical protein
MFVFDLDGTLIAAFDHSQRCGGEAFADHPADVTALLLGQRHGR